MIRGPSFLTLATAVGLTVATASPCVAAGLDAPQARLVHCGIDTCLRISGHRARDTLGIRIAGRDVTVEGGRAWHVTVPLATARRWADRSGISLAVALADAGSAAQSERTVMLPPGALGPRVELASLEVRAH